MRKASILLGIIIILIAGSVVLGLPARLARSYLRSHASPWSTMPSGDGRFKVVLFRYPVMQDLPESLGFGQGFVQLLEAHSGRVLAQKDAEDLAQINLFRWTSNRVLIQGFAEWDLPP